MPKFRPLSHHPSDRFTLCRRDVTCVTPLWCRLQTTAKAGPLFNYWSPRQCVEVWDSYTIYHCIVTVVLWNMKLLHWASKQSKIVPGTYYNCNTSIKWVFHHCHYTQPFTLFYISNENMMCLWSTGSQVKVTAQSCLMWSESTWRREYISQNMNTLACINQKLRTRLMFWNTHLDRQMDRPKTISPWSFCRGHNSVLLYFIVLQECWPVLTFPLCL